MFDLMNGPWNTIFGFLPKMRKDGISEVAGSHRTESGGAKEHYAALDHMMSDARWRRGLKAGKPLDIPLWHRLLGLGGLYQRLRNEIVRLQEKLETAEEHAAEAGRAGLEALAFREFAEYVQRTQPGWLGEYKFERDRPAMEREINDLKGKLSRLSQNYNDLHKAWLVSFKQGTQFAPPPPKVEPET